MQTRILKMNVNVTSIKETLTLIKALIARGHGAYICVANVHMCMEVFDDPSFAKIVNQADYVLPDGRPLSWAQRILTKVAPSQVRGQDITNEICKLSAHKGIKIGFYGGATNDILTRVNKQLSASYPGVDIAFSFSPPFRELTEQEDNELCNQIKDAELDVLFVGIGCPKQEKWMAAHKDKLTCVMLGVGAAFDFIAGDKKHAPNILQKIGMEWFFRLLTEPQRLWKRYFKHNPRFVYYLILQLLFNKKNP